MSTQVPRPSYAETSRGGALPAGTARQSATTVIRRSFATWLPEECLFDMEAAATFEAMKQYLILIENLVREGKSEAEIEAAVKQLVDEDEQALDEPADDLDRAA
jgi:hypothetical protein